MMTNIAIKGGDLTAFLVAMIFDRKIRYISAGSCAEIQKDEKILRVSKKNIFVVLDMIKYFNYYFNAVEPVCIGGNKLVDYSAARFHEVIGYDLHPVIFPSVAEPVITTGQYLGFSKIVEGSTVLDLGAYSGLTSIMFFEKTGRKGRVIAVEADKNNIECCKKNFKLYKSITRRSIELFEGAVWNQDCLLEFSHEGHMGSSATSVKAVSPGSRVEKVRAYKLSTLAKKLKLKKIDFIKCDIEGAEAYVFDDPDFFRKFRPRIIIEPHKIRGKDSADSCRSVLTGFGYKIRSAEQKGADIPLLECVPGKRSGR